MFSAMKKSAAEIVWLIVFSEAAQSGHCSMVLSSC